MIYGKATTKVESEHGAVYLTVTGMTCTLKQGSDLIRLEIDQLAELGRDIEEAIAELAAHYSNKPSNK